MTIPFLTAKKLAVVPWLEIYENKGPSQPPKKLGYTPKLPGPVTKAKFSPDQNVMALVSSLRREDIPGLGNPDDPSGGGVNSGNTDGTRVFSPDDKFVMFCGTTTTLAAMYYKSGPAYAPAAFPVPALPGFIKAIAMTPNGQHVALINNAVPNTMKVYEKAVDPDGVVTWNFLVDKVLGFAASHIEFAGDDYLLATDRVTASPQHKIYRMITNLPEVANPPTAGYILKVIKRTAGTYWFYVTPVSSGAWVMYSLTGTTWTAAYSRTLPGTFPSIVRIDAARNGDVAAVYTVRGSGGTGSNVYMYSWTDTGGGTGYYTEGYTSPAAGNFSALGQIAFSPSGKLFAIAYGAGTGTAEIWSVSNDTLPVFTKLVTVPNGSSSGYTFKGFSDNEKIAHFSKQAGVAASPISTVTPYGAVTTYPWAPGVAVSTITDYTISPTGRTVLWRDGGGAIQGSTQDGGGDYLDFRDIDGVFVTIYDREVEGEVVTFEERAYAQHVLGSIITDIVISKTSQLLSYHVSNAAGFGSGLGRFLYWITDKDKAQMDFLGAEYATGDVRSFLAFSPYETHFVVVYENPALGDTEADVRLYKFGTNYAYVQRDAEPVLFGPPAFSACATVIVAHGGPAPFTLFNHIIASETLEKTDVPVNNWTDESIVLAVAFTNDCAGIVIVTDDKVIIIAPGEDDEQEVKDEVDNEDDGDDDDEDVDIIVETPEIIVVIGEPGDNGDPGDNWTIDPEDWTINQIQYIPYVSVNVTFRTW